ncbi:MAG: CPBP family intramembrane metalloprotease [Thermoanaerobaculia bacterium]|nr:CPBP family intramembrane metalloprotease [Thermoanaerobaculia bacterium]
MNDEAAEPLKMTGRWVVTSVLLFWVGYVLVTLVVGFATSSTIGNEVLQLTAWGLVSSAGLVVLSRFLVRIEKGSRTSLDLAVRPSSLRKFAIGVCLGVASFGIHLSIVATFAGPIRFELVSGVGAAAALIYFVRFLSTSCMEELGFRGYALRRLTGRMGPWPAVWLTALAFGLSHFLYGWDVRTIALGVVPGGLLWGMSAIATRGLAVPIGLHAAWNFASWSAGSRAETGLLRMVIEEDALELTQAVGTASYLSIFGALTVAFWFVHRRNVRLATGPGL